MVVIYIDEKPRGKVLDKDIATSIMASNELLQANDSLKKVADCRDNVYYHVKDTETVIMHVEDDFCILCDYNVKGKDLPEEMKKEHYAVYQLGGRDWVKNSATGRLIGYDIKEFVHGYGIRPAGMTLDHEGETFDEREKNKNFSSTNYNNGSHRVRVTINSQEALNELIDKIKENENKKGGMFLK